MITIIAAITRDHAIGRNGDMLYHISADLRRFKQLTMGHPLIMGRRTLESFPKGPLPGRTNVVLTRQDISISGVETEHSLESAIQRYGSQDPFIIGGGQIYAEALPYAQKLAITEIDAESEGADTFFPEIDPAEWRQISVSDWEIDPRSGARFRHVDYLRN